MSDEDEGGTSEGEKVQVDRKRLEAMITGKPVYGTTIVLPKAHDFFDKVSSLSGAKILWPNKLKIGAKTKKDPFVKVLGKPEQIESARQLISATLQRKRDRVTLKIFIPHSSHSHIIGRQGRGSKRIMGETHCHVHFPDSHKSRDKTLEDEMKSDQVSITGAPEQVDKARTLLRNESLLIISFDLPWFSPVSPPLPTLLPQVTASVHLQLPGWTVSLRASVGDASAVEQSITTILNSFGIPPSSWLPELRLEMRSPCMRHIRQFASMKRVEEMAMQENVRLHTSSTDQFVLLFGSFHGLMKIHQLIINELPISLLFDCPNDGVPLEMSTFERVYGIEASVKAKNSAQSAEHSVIVLRATEENIEKVYRARETMLGLEGWRDEEVENAKQHKKEEEKKLEAENRNVLDALFAQVTLDHSNGFANSFKTSLRSPDPDDSPIAHSLLKRAKEINKNAELWSNDTQPIPEVHATRNEMMLKANQAILDSSFHHLRYPTDLWAGYGFSASSPAGLLKMPPEAPKEEPSSSSYLNSRQGGLTSVKEDEELSHYDTPSFARECRIPYIPKGTLDFSASSSIFESPPVSVELVWDVDAFNDPAMVLAQIGCSEYLPQFRAHEIDMRALLLSDEQSLKEIGVTTVGARKKIFHAILKLRESARSKGYDY